MLQKTKPITKTTMVTASGVLFDLANPELDDVLIEDIAKHLSGLTRFVNATCVPINVAHHSVSTADMLAKHGKDLQLKALLHDAHEAYTGDISSPMKAMLPELSKIQDRIQAVIHQRFGLTITRIDTALIKAEDRRQLFSEAMQFMPISEVNWSHYGSEWDFYEIIPMSSQDSEIAFLDRFKRFGGE